MIKALFCLVKLVLAVVFVGTLVVQGHRFSREVSAEVHRAKQRFDERFAKQPSKTLSDLLSLKANQYQLDPIILKIILKKESNDGQMDSLYRFEPALYQRLRSMKSYRGMSDSEVRMMASSHGPYHILGATGKDQCGLHFSELYDNEKSTDCAARIVKRLMDENGGEIKQVFRGYNGSGPAAERYAIDAMLHLAELLYVERTVKG